MTEIKFKKHALLKEEWKLRKLRIRMNILTSLPKIFEVKVNILTSLPKIFEVKVNIKAE